MPLGVWIKGVKVLLSYDDERFGGLEFKHLSFKV